jgi:hypothetical protein
MSLDVRIDGGAELKKLAAQIKASGDKGLGREMAAGLRKVARPVQASIREEYAGLPASGGYQALFSKSLRFRTESRAASRTASFRLTTFADGTAQRRDIDALEGGRLRHPVYGRSRRLKVGPYAGNSLANPWAVTRVKGDFHKRGTDKAADSAEKEMLVVLREFSAKLIK